MKFGTHSFHLGTACTTAAMGYPVERNTDDGILLCLRLLISLKVLIGSLFVNCSFSSSGSWMAGIRVDLQS